MNLKEFHCCWIEKMKKESILFLPYHLEFYHCHHHHHRHHQFHPCHSLPVPSWEGWGNYPRKEKMHIMATVCMPFAQVLHREGPKCCKQKRNWMLLWNSIYFSWEEKKNETFSWEKELYIIFINALGFRHAGNTSHTLLAFGRALNMVFFGQNWLEHNCQKDLPHSCSCHQAI